MAKKVGRKYRAITRNEVESHLAERVRSWNGLLEILAKGVGDFIKEEPIPVTVEGVVALLHPVDPQTLDPAGNYEWQVEVACLDSGQLAVISVFFRGIELCRQEALDALVQLFTRQDRYPRRVKVPDEHVPDYEILWAMRQNKYGLTEETVA